jgi:hypothetical protein
LIALFVNTISSETNPISSFLFAPTLYIVSSLLAIGFRLFWWLTLEKGTMFEAKHVFIRTIQDIIVINVVVLSTLSAIFLWETYLQ